MRTKYLAIQSAVIVVPYAHEVLSYSKCCYSCALNALGSSMLTIDDGRAFQSVTVLGRKEYL